MAGCRVVGKWDAEDVHGFQDYLHRLDDVVEDTAFEGEAFLSVDEFELFQDGGLAGFAGTCHDC